MTAREFSKAKHCHHDTPSEGGDTGEAIRERAFQASGFHPNGQDFSDCRAEVERNGGAAAVVDRAVKRAEKAGQQ